MRFGSIRNGSMIDGQRLFAVLGKAEALVALGCRQGQRHGGGRRLQFALALIMSLVLGTAIAAEPPQGAEPHFGADAGAGADAFGIEAEARAHAYMALDPPDWAGAHAAFGEAARAGSPTAMSYLGWLHEEGHGVPKDGTKAAAWYARAARAGAPDFALKLGWMYLGGDGVARDREQAEFWFEQAIAAGHVPAQIAWASVLIADAQGGRNPERVFEARDLLEQALAEGYVLGAYFLARIHLEGIGSQTVDAAQAFHYTRIGAELGHAQMQGWLAFLYRNGQGVAADPVSAAQWANLAAAEGDTLGQQLRLALEAELEPAEVAEARRRAVDWALERR